MEDQGGYNVDAPHSQIADRLSLLEVGTFFAQNINYFMDQGILL